VSAGEISEEVVQATGARMSLRSCSVITSRYCEMRDARCVGVRDEKERQKNRSHSYTGPRLRSNATPEVARYIGSAWLPARPVVIYFYRHSTLARKGAMMFTFEVTLPTLAMS